MKTNQDMKKKNSKEDFFTRIKNLFKNKEKIGYGLIDIFQGKKINDDLFEELENQLLISDIGIDTTRKIMSNLTRAVSHKQLNDVKILFKLLKDEMTNLLKDVEEPLNINKDKIPFIILIVGVNGVGKTTTIGKLAFKFKHQKKSVMLAAGDTFRAAAVDQLKVWGEYNNVPVISQHTGVDSASVIFDAVQAAKARNIDVLIVDTAGRFQNKSHLMAELKKIVRVIKKLDEDAPHETMLIIDARTGQNAISQARMFHEAVGLTGITLTKLDNSSMGGVLFSIADQLGTPVRYIGISEHIEDLYPFNVEKFIEAILPEKTSSNSS